MYDISYGVCPTVCFGVVSGSFQGGAFKDFGVYKASGVSLSDQVFPSEGAEKRVWEFRAWGLGGLRFRRFWNLSGFRLEYSRVYGSISKTMFWQMTVFQVSLEGISFQGFRVWELRVWI